MPSVYTLPSLDIEVGVGLSSVALPPLSVKAKSLFSSAPDPFEALKIASDIVAVTVLLLAATLMLCTVAGVLSFKFAVFPVWVVLEILSRAS